MGIICIIAASLLFGVIPSVQNNVLIGGTTPVMLVVICNGTAGLIALADCVIRKRRLRLTCDELKWMILIGAIGLFMTDYLLDIAYTLIPVGFVTMIHFLYPTIVCAALTVLFHEKMNLYRGGAVATSLAGLVLLAGGGMTGRISGLAAAFGSAVFYAFYLTATDKTPANRIDPMTRTFYTNLFAGLAALITAAWMMLANGSRMTVPAGAAEWAQCLLISVMLMLATLLVNVGIAKIGAVTASFISTIEPVSSLVISAAAFHYAVGLRSLAGCGFIICSLLFAAGDERSAGK